MHLVASVLLATSALGQDPFSLDTTFHTVIQQQYVNSLAVMPSGELLISGTMRFPGEFSDRLLAKLNSAGTRVPSFPFTYGGGKLTNWTDRYYVANGQIVRRLLPDGTWDSGYIGMNAGPYVQSLQGGDYHVYPDGRVLISGKHTLNDAVRGFVGNYNLIWFTNTGYLDTTRIHRKGNGVLNKLKELPEGGIIVSGSCTQFEGTAVDGIFRTDALGVPDTTFHSGVFWGSARDYLPLPDGRLYIVGNYQTSHAPNDTLRLGRFLQNGSLDPTFNIPHFTLGALPNIGGYGPAVAGVRLWGADQLLVTGQFQYVNGQPRRGICVMDTTGVLTDDLDDCGVSSFTYFGITNASVHGLVPDADSTHYYIWGTYTGYSDGVTNDPLQRFVTRLHAGDITTGASSTTAPPVFSLYPNPSSGNVTLELERVPGNALLVVRDALGKEVRRQRVTDHYTLLSLSKSGMYVVELWDGTSRLAAKRIVVE